MSENGTDPPVCGAVAVHPDLGELTCTLEPHETGSHSAPDPDAEGAVIEWDDDTGVVEAAAVFDIEAFVKALPEGVALCPLCVGIGAVNEDPPFDPHTHRCKTCKGYGDVLTGSLVGEYTRRKCSDCGGAGYVENEPGRVPATPARSSDFSGDERPRDNEGRTPDDPDFDWSAVVRDVEPIPAAAVE